MRPAQGRPDDGLAHMYLNKAADELDHRVKHGSDIEPKDETTAKVLREWRFQARLLRDVAMFLDPEPEPDAIIIQAVSRSAFDLAAIINGGKA